MSEISAVANKYGINYGFLIAYLVGLSAFGSFVNDMYMPSLPSMVRFFHCPVPVCELGVAFGMLGLGLGEVVMGPMSDRYGRKPVLIASLLIFVGAALTSIFSPTIQFFIGCRFFQGCGAAGGYFLARTIPTDMYSGRMLARIMAVVGAINGFAPASAPVIGGLVSQTFGWRGVFVVLTLFALLLLVLSRLLSETHPANPAGSVWKAFGSYRRLIANRPFMTFVLLKGGALGLLFAYISSAPFIMQTRFGFSQLQFGLIIGVNSVMVATGSMLALKFKDLTKAGMTGALLLMAASTAQSFYMIIGHSFLPYELLLLPMLLSLGMLFTVGNTLAMNAGRADAGGASAVVGVAGYAFGAMVTPVVGLGDVMHSAAWSFLALAAITLLAALLTRKYASPGAKTDPPSKILSSKLS